MGYEDLEYNTSSYAERVSLKNTAGTIEGWGRGLGRNYYKYVLPDLKGYMLLKDTGVHIKTSDETGMFDIITKEKIASDGAVGYKEKLKLYHCHGNQEDHCKFANGKKFFVPQEFLEPSTVWVYLYQKARHKLGWDV